MKSAFLTILYLALFCTHAHSQWEVKYVDTDFPGSLHVIKAINDSTLFAMGDASACFRSYDAGESWEGFDTGLDMDFLDIERLGDSVLLAVGRAQMVRSTDLGQSWSVVYSDEAEAFHAIAAVSDGAVLVAGYTGIYQSTDQGQSWQTVWSLEGAGYEGGEISSLHFADQQVGLAAGHGFAEDIPGGLDRFILRTTDQGASWVAGTDLGADFLFAPGLDFTDTQTGYLHLDNGQLFKTTDQGISWDLQGGNYGDVTDLSFVSTDRAFSTCAHLVFVGGFGPEGAILSTEDQGVSWEVLPTPGIPLFDVDFQNDSTGFVVGKHALIMKYNADIEGIAGAYPDFPSSSSHPEARGFHIEVLQNPFQDFIQLSTEQEGTIDVQIMLFDATGRKVMAQQMRDGALQIPAAHLPKGPYFLYARSADGAKVVQLIKM
ncbi:MAG: T9SS type A sorting domain-containing protein [bacterium]|nr:T9SS type A sorting domain-containing protein [bacterium]